jgi:hypothetical protein
LSAFESARDDLYKHITSEHQAWLLGAGISCRSGIPLMYPLTELVQIQLGDSEAGKIYQALRKQLREDAHIEHVLSHLGDLIALSERSRLGSIEVDSVAYKGSDLRSHHGRIRDEIARVIHQGYHPAAAGQPLRIGSPDDNPVRVDAHRAFVKALLSSRARPGRYQRAVSFFTSNYDTLLEDALALEKVSYVDGFSGGAMAYWAPDSAFSEASGAGGTARARVFKLHGSIDWHWDDASSSVIRCRHGCNYPARAGNVLVYPQSTKYRAAQTDPFAHIFSAFRGFLRSGQSNVLCIMGYSFGDEHIDLEIEAAMESPGSRTVIIAFSEERKDDNNFKIAPRLAQWLDAKPWRERVFAATNRGLYHGSLTNLMQEGTISDWWTFEGVTRLFDDGPQYQPEVSSLTPPPPPEADGNA